MRIKNTNSLNETPNIIGINIGSVSVNVVGFQNGNQTIHVKEAHKGNPQQSLKQILHRNFSSSQNYYGISGTFGSITEVKSIERGIQSLSESYDAVLSLGGETFLLYLLNEEGHINNIISQDKCGAGSGEFFLQQIDRLNLSLPEAIQIAKTGNHIQIASRCSVHCKSDITHKLNKNEAKIEDILYSLLLNIVNKAKALLLQARNSIKKVLIIGGMCENETFLEILHANLTEYNFFIDEYSSFFEAYGTALLVQDNPRQKTLNLQLIKSFSTLPALQDSKHLVKRMDHTQDPITFNPTTAYLLGIDVGSTTTKAVLVDPETLQIAASHYGRTNGNPILATQDCIRELISQVGKAKISLVGVTGSGRSMVGAYVGTPAIFNEISAHAAGAAHFEPDLDTIFEIGGQDAKYMFLQNGVPIDYAMNASCSAGTGSFLEESAKCDLGISVYDICENAMKAKSAVRFKADCAAFINSDIRTALQEGYTKTEIISGLVYSIATNYLNKVKGSRPIGHKIFLQGGVAKNHAVGYAFAQITGREIIIPPSPELMGAFGIALLTKIKLEHKEIESFEIKTLDTLIQDELVHINNFTCKGCENFCQIERYRVGERTFPFGGKCSRWENKRKSAVSHDKLDLVEYRNKVFYGESEKTQVQNISESQIKIGIPRALLTHSLYPLYKSYFEELGFQVILSGIEKDMTLLSYASFCYPMQILHGAVANLTKQNVDYIFLPYIYKMKKGEDWEDSTFCPITQSSTYVISRIFDQIPILSPELDFSKSYEANDALINMAITNFNLPVEICSQAYKKAVSAQLAFERENYEKGQELLKHIIASQEIGVIVVGRSYNVFPAETSQSIPKKLVSMGMNVIPFECLPQTSNSHFPWYFANYVTEAVELVKQHKNLFLLYINNFSCTIDAFIQNFVRSEMGAKPYLLLELDAHVADAGTQTRLEAFREIINNYQHIHNHIPKEPFSLAKVLNENGKIMVVNSKKEKMSVKDRRVKLYVPCFSQIHTTILEKLLVNFGFNAGHSGDIDLNYPVEGLKYCSGKECLPLPVVLGHIMQLVEQKQPDEVIGYFMISGGSPCVVCDYDHYIEEVLQKNQIKDVFVFSFDKHNNYMGANSLDFTQYAPKLVVLGDILCEIQSSLEVVGKANSLGLFNQYLAEFHQDFVKLSDLNPAIEGLIAKLKTIPRIGHPYNFPRVVLSGDFFVRYSPLFLAELKSMYNEQKIIVKSTDLFELFLYGIPFGNMVNPDLRDHFVQKIRKKLNGEYRFWKDFSVPFYISQLIYKYMQRIERKLRNQFDVTGLLYAEPTDIMSIVERSEKFINPLIFGEAIVTVGRALEIIEDHSYDSLILIGPQNCLPYRISQAILKPIFMERNFPIMVFDADISPMTSNMKRLIQTNIEQILRNKSRLLPISSEHEGIIGKEKEIMQKI